jgi:hypothetical protein
MRPDLNPKICGEVVGANPISLIRDTGGAFIEEMRPNPSRNATAELSI